MTNPLIHWLILAVFIALIHVYIIKVKKRSPNKAFWFWIRFGICGLFLIYEYYIGVHNPIVYVSAYILSAWFLYDTIIAVLLGRKPWYLNSTGPIDKAQASIGPGMWVMKAIASLTLIAMYFLNEF